MITPKIKRSNPEGDVVEINKRRSLHLQDLVRSAPRRQVSIRANILAWGIGPCQFGCFSLAITASLNHLFVGISVAFQPNEQVSGSFFVMPLLGLIKQIQMLR